ncbi:ABC transporter substrate-binding protein [Streptomyces sp. 6N223]|uniref:ABC transporter substrate-binding protein n=1 Tax=Streptomyces sp. 6N223 TaxID=3457412 RepID=UPI003FD3C4CF
MPRSTRPRFRLAATLATASALLLGATLTACGSPEENEPDNAGGNPGNSADQGAFPVTIEHRFGATTIEEEPQKIVTVGLTDQDAVLALGKVPVGVTQWPSVQEAAVGPWAQDEMDAIAGAEEPTLLKDSGTGPQLERITELGPDLILALYAGLTQEQYDNLSRIAPVVTAPEEFEDWGIPWQDQTLITGQALGVEDEAQQLVDDVQSSFDTARQNHPEFEGATGIVATPYEGYFVFGSRDQRSRLLTELGFTLPTDLDEAIGDSWGANISNERTDLLDQSAAVWIVPDPATAPDELHGDDLYADLPVVTEGREVFIGETTDYGAALSFSTVLAMPYVVERLTPQLAAAVDGDPGTAVEHPAD